MRISRSSKPHVVITMGDPSGIGPEVTLKALASPKVQGLANFLIIGDASVLAKASRDMGCKPFGHVLDMANVPAKDFSYGKTGALFGKASMRYVDMALELAAAHEADAIVTAPVNKYSVKESGIRDFQGHTEYMAARSGIKNFAMMFVGKDLKVTLVTRHISLKRVPCLLKTGSVYDAIMLTHKYLKEYFRISSPKIAVCGLNPHAGESGAFGKEEGDIIIPALKKASRRVKNIFGPVPADVAFYNAVNKKYDAVIAMYHDQGLAPFKLLYFDSGVNLTLGLPFIRTSPDHGTAFNIAGRGVADPTSMIEAIRLACRLQRCLPKHS